MTLDVSFDMLYPIRPNPLLDFRKPWPDHSRFSKEQTNKQTYYTDSTPLSHDGHDQLGWPPPKLTKEDKQSWSLSYGSNNLWNLVMMPNLTLGQKFQAHRMLDPWVHHTILHVYHQTLMFKDMFNDTGGLHLGKQSRKYVIHGRLWHEISKSSSPSQCIHSFNTYKSNPSGMWRRICVLVSKFQSKSQCIDWGNCWWTKPKWRLWWFEERFIMYRANHLHQLWNGRPSCKIVKPT